MKRVLAGIRATGQLHLGNYLGAVKGMLALQADPEYQTLYMVADAHTITTPYQPEQLKQDRRTIMVEYLAAGLDPNKSILFQQSAVSAHFELSFYFSSVMSIARMQHLPTFKEKVKQYPDSASMALLNYPILMAADILLYKAGMVPVGIDQEPHLEIAREVARKMNEVYHLDFPEPVRFVTPGEYVPSLRGEGKMSKSVEGSAISLNDDLATIQKKLASCPTDSGKGEQIPTKGGVASLLKFVELFIGVAEKKSYEQAYLTDGIRYGDLKHDLAQKISASIAPIQAKRQELLAKPKEVDEIIAAGNQLAMEIAQVTLAEVKDHMGLV